MPRFADFRQATKAGVPNYVAAAQIDDEENARRYERNMELATEGIDAAGEWKGDRTLAEALRRKPAAGEAAPMATPETAPAPVTEPTVTQGAAPIPADVNAAPDTLRGDLEAALATPPLDPEAVMADAATDAATDTATDVATDAAVDAGTDVATDAAVDAGAGATTAGMPVAAMLRGGKQLADGDYLGALGTGAKAALAAAGPLGLAGSVGLGLMGV